MVINLPDFQRIPLFRYQSPFQRIPLFRYQSPAILQPLSLFFPTSLLITGMVDPALN
jgi:hypothetical protein